MIWEDLILQRAVERPDVVHALSSVLATSEESVLLCDDVTECGVLDGVDVLCEWTPIAGAFCVRLTIYLRDPGLTKLATLDTVGRLAEHLNTLCLVSSRSANPYEWLLVTGRDDMSVAHVDPEGLEQAPEEWIVSCPAADSGAT